MASISALGVGSGLDLTGLLDKLRAGEEKQLVPIQTHKALYQAKISAFGQIKSALASFQDAANAISGPEAFQAVSGAVTGEALTAATTADTPTGTYQVHVQQLAQASSDATLGVTEQDTNLGGGTVDFTLANGETMSVAIDADASSLQDIRNAINNQDGGVRASIINDGSGTPYRLVLQAAQSGSDAAVTNIQFGGDLATSLQLDAATHQDGTNTELTINGIAIQSPGNQVEGAIQGVTLNVTKLGDATLQVTRDDTAIKKGVQDFVDAYNKLSQSIDTLTSYDADTQSAGILLGNSTVRGVESRLRRVMSDAIENGGSFSVLSQVGVSLQLDGTLKLDGDKLDKAINDNLGDLSRLFAGGGAATPGLADNVDDAIDSMTGTGGLISAATDGLKSSISSLDELYSQRQDRIDALMARYKSQFSKLDSMIAKMNSTSSYLTTQFDKLDAITDQGS